MQNVEEHNVPRVASTASWPPVHSLAEFCSTSSKGRGASFVRSSAQKSASKRKPTPKAGSKKRRRNVIEQISPEEERQVDSGNIAQRVTDVTDVLDELRNYHSYTRKYMITLAQFIFDEFDNYTKMYRDFSQMVESTRDPSLTPPPPPPAKAKRKTRVERIVEARVGGSAQKNGSAMSATNVLRQWRNARTELVQQKIDEQVGTVECEQDDDDDEEDIHIESDDNNESTNNGESNEDERDALSELFGSDDHDDDDDEQSSELKGGGQQKRRRTDDDDDSRTKTKPTTSTTTTTTTTPARRKANSAKARRKSGGGSSPLANGTRRTSDESARAAAMPLDMQSLLVRLDSKHHAIMTGMEEMKRTLRKVQQNYRKYDVILTEKESEIFSIKNRLRAHLQHLNTQALKQSMCDPNLNVTTPMITNPRQLQYVSSETLASATGANGGSASKSRANNAKANKNKKNSKKAATTGSAVTQKKKTTTSPVASTKKAKPAARTTEQASQPKKKKRAQPPKESDVRVEDDDDDDDGFGDDDGTMSSDGASCSTSFSSSSSSDSPVSESQDSGEPSEDA